MKLMHSPQGLTDANEETLQECLRIQKLARAVDELVAWDFIMDEKEAILAELERAVEDAEQELQRADVGLERQRQRCALISIGPHDASGETTRRPYAARGEDSALIALWQAQGDAFIQQYERHLTRYKRLWLKLQLQEDELTPDSENNDKDAD
ncbi:hypothetical protein DQ04_07831010 [Trypanosoma grayi]|uniref:hypothetical protein n=1 Tax=Trypanosoma grayi TaxID=71804 RepID=UPI0004F4849C|nr:hypothetical protein DQ04_07831010 [Trypanosoma grayi]KEG08173.1 hypothetical protein DQ04_07831010 [Trypanosoma grayi]